MTYTTTKRWKTEARRLVSAYVCGHAAKTDMAYASDLEDLAEFMGSGAAEDAVAELLRGGPASAYAIAARYKGHLRESLAAATVNRRLAAVRGILNKARQTGIIGWSVEIKPLRARAYRNTRGPGRDGFRRMLQLARDAGGPKAYRDLAMLHLLYDLALRRSELAGLDLQHVDLRRPAVCVLGKGCSEREWYDMPLPTQEAMAAWLAVRGDTPGPLFYSYAHARRGKGTRLSDMGVYWLVRQVSTRAGCRTTPHGLRHSAITDALQMGHSAADVREFSRHKNLNTLQIYYDQAMAIRGDIAADLSGSV